MHEDCYPRGNNVTYTLFNLQNREQYALHPTKLRQEKNSEGQLRVRHNKYLKDNKLQISVRHNNFIIFTSNVCYMFRSYFDHLQALIYIIQNQCGYALKIYFVICEISRILPLSL